MSRTTIAVAMVILLGAALPAMALAEPVAFKLLPKYSRATFKSDAPLETFVGNTADTGITAPLTVDPARPQAAKGVVKVNMNEVSPGIDKRDADMRSKD
mgnify:CR=1 FL=1